MAADAHPGPLGGRATCSAEQGLRAGFFTGAEDQKRRTQNIVEFHDDPAFRMLFTSDAGGVGLNLQRAANCVINLELPWNPAVLEQRIGRIYRLGQKQPIDVYNLVSEQGIESRIAGLVGSKQAFFKGLFDGETDTVRFGEASGFLSRIKKLIDPSAIAVVSARGGQAEAEPDRGETDTDLDIDIDDEVVDPLDELIEAADEADDSPLPEPSAAANGDGRGEAGAAAAVPTTTPPEPEPVIRPTPPPEPAANGAVHPATPAVEGPRSPVRRPVSGNSSLSSRSGARRAARSSSRRRPRPPTSCGALFEGMAALLQSIARQ